MVDFGGRHTFSFYTTDRSSQLFSCVYELVYSTVRFSAAVKTSQKVLMMKTVPGLERERLRERGLRLRLRPDRDREAEAARGGGEGDLLRLGGIVETSPQVKQEDKSEIRNSFQETCGPSLSLDNA